MDDFKSVSLELRSLLERSIHKYPAEGILLSGGLDTSIIALLASKHLKKAFTVTLEGWNRDLKYAEMVAEFLDLDLEVYYFSEEEMIDAVTESIRILRTYIDYEIRSAVPVLIAMKLAKRYVGSVYVGEGADELFFGYGPIADMVNSIVMAEDDYYGGGFFTSNFEKDFQIEFLSNLFFDLGGYFGYPHKLGRGTNIRVHLPYMDAEVIRYALKIPLEYKVKSKDGKIWGKWILRKTFEGDLPEEIIWRDKTPIDVGTGSIKLREILKERMTEEELEEKKMIYRSKGIKIDNEEQSFYYERYCSDRGALKADPEDV